MGSISQRIKYYRKKRGLTMEEVASALGIRTDNYAKYESGMRTPKDERVIKLAKLFKTSYRNLIEGVENTFVGLLNRHAIGAVLGDVDGYDSFLSDMKSSKEAYDVVIAFWDKGADMLKQQDKVYYNTFIKNPDLRSLSSLYELYESLRDKNMNEPVQNESMPNEAENGYPSLDEEITTKWAFCVAAYRYLEANDLDSIIAAAKNYAVNIDPIQFFAIKVFVPYLSFIIETVEFCKNTTIDDFEIAFLFDALTPPEVNEEFAASDEE